MTTEPHMATDTAEDLIKYFGTQDRMWLKSRTMNLIRKDRAAKDRIWECASGHSWTSRFGVVLWATFPVPVEIIYCSRCGEEKYPI